MVNSLGVLFGRLFRWVYDFVARIADEPEFISYYAISIIIMTIILKFLMLPLFIKQNNAMKKMASVQPKINELQRKYQDDPQVLNQKMMALMKEEKYNPMGGCLPMLINFPIIMGFFRMMQNPEVYIFTDGIYQSIRNNFFWIADLREPDPWILPLISAVATFLSSKITQKNQMTPQAGEQAQQMKQMNDTMMIMFPIMIFWMGRKFAAGLSLYWAVSTIFQVIQGIVLNKDMSHIREEAVDKAEEEKQKKRKKIKE